MIGPLSPQQSALLALVPADGATVGTTSLREQLGWEKAAYTAVRFELVAAGLLGKGKGRGGSVKRCPSVASKTKHRNTHATRRNPPTAFDPHSPPVLHFQEGIIGLRESLDEPRSRPLTVEETKKPAASLGAPQLWLEWTGKRETQEFVAEPVALPIRGRFSAQAILKAVGREFIECDLFADGMKSAKEVRAHYRYDFARADHLVTGESLRAITSRAGQVQIIYFDPRYRMR